MKSNRTLWLSCILFVACCSCSMDGGSRGSGISTAQGNVESVQMAALRKPSRGKLERLFVAVSRLLSVQPSALAQTGLEGITVTVEGTSASAQTDANGFFAIHGNFEGRLSLFFQRAADGLAARAAVNIPAGGTLTLNNVRVDNPTGQAAADSQSVDFEGLITRIDCPGETLTLVSSHRSPTDTDTYTVRTNTSSLRDSRGNAITCQDFESGEPVRVTGSVNDDGTFGGGTIATVG